MSNSLARPLVFILIFVLALTGAVAEPWPVPEADAGIQIGAYYADVWNGLSYIHGSRAAFLLRIGWIDPGAGQKEKGEDLAYTFTGSASLPGEGRARYRNGRIWDEPVRVGPACPDGTFSRVSWRAGDAWITFEWGQTGEGAAVGRVSADGPARVALHATPSWDVFTASYALTQDGIRGAGRRGGAPSAPAVEWELRAGRRPLASICLSYAADVPPLIVAGLSGGAGEGTHAALVFDLEPGAPLEFSAGFGPLPELHTVSASLASAEKAYESRRIKASGDWGPFLQAMMNQLNHNKVYNFQTGRVCHVITRNWCRGDGQILFKWDSFFNALMASLEDPRGAGDTIRGVLAAQQPDGLIPSYSGPRWEVSWDRSQPPVEAMCVWKVHQRRPDPGLLAEVYPRLVAAHEWWFKVRPETGLPYRDGNRNGLLEWGTNKPRPDLTLARYESGMDDSPMFDRVTVNERSGTMELDAVGLSSLWAVNAGYLSRIADSLGKKAEAEVFRRQSGDMVRRINERLWDEDAGSYSNRYWTAGSRKNPGEPIPSRCLETPAGEPGLLAEYFKGTGFEDARLTRIDPDVDFILGPAPEAVGRFEYSVRWSGFLKPEMSGLYRFTVISDDGFRLWIDGKPVLADWSVHEREVDISEPLGLEAGRKIPIRLEYFQERWKSRISLGWIFGDPAPNPRLLSSRLSPTCFFPMIAGAPGEERGRRMAALLLDPAKFLGDYLIPSITRDDPAFPELHYWRGKIWPSANYLVYQGLKRYLKSDQCADFTRKNLRLFMNNWFEDGGCYENYTPDGKGSSDPHYSWGALLCLIALEEVCDIEPDGNIRLNGGLEESLSIENLPLYGRNYDVSVTPGKTRILENGRQVLEAAGTIEKRRLKKSG